MSKKHFEAIASVFRGYSESQLAYDEYQTVRMIAEDLADVCAADNTRFDRERFLRACGVLS